VGFRYWLIRGIRTAHCLRGGGGDLLDFDLAATIEKNVLGVDPEPQGIEGNVM
jgi:hypothetical protein